MHLALRILTATRGVERVAQRTLRPFGLTPAQFNVLELIVSQDEGMMASEIARALAVDPSNVTTLLRRMSRQGLLGLRENPRDLRQHRVVPTESGRSSHGAARQAYDRSLWALESDCEPAVLAAADQAIRRICERADGGAPPERSPAPPRTRVRRPRAPRASSAVADPFPLPMHLM